MTYSDCCGTGRYPTDCRRPEGRWDDGTIDVLYTATSAKGALAEVRYHLSQQQPLAPDFLSYRMFRIPVERIDVVNVLIPSARSPDANSVILTQESVDAHCGEPKDLGLADI